jgi:large subunit ribosomal protein L24
MAESKNMKKIRKGDLVIVLAGKNKGKQGVVVKVIPTCSKVVVSGVSLVKKHVKPNPVKGTDGGFLPKEMPIHISNVALFSNNNSSADRVGIKLNNDGKKVRFLKRSSEILG